MNNILTNIIRATSVVVLLMAVPTVAGAALDTTGCDNENNEYINPELALCSTHVYNIGAVANPQDESARQVMRDVVALKTTVITQQMYSQYQILETTIKRLKTQLQKQILLDQLHVAAGDSGTSSADTSLVGANNGNNRNMYIAGVDNCNNKSTTVDVFTCLRSNYNYIYNGSAGGTNITTELRKQLVADYRVMENGKTRSNPKNSDGADVDCHAVQNISSRKNFQACLDDLNAGIRTGYEGAIQAQQKKANNNN